MHLCASAFLWIIYTHLLHVQLITIYLLNVDVYLSARSADDSVVEVSRETWRYSNVALAI